MNGSKWIVWWPPLALAALVIAAYANGLFAPFIFDDPLIVQLYAGGNPARFLNIGNSVRPLYALTFWLNAAIAGDVVWAYRAVNIVIHLGAALLLYALVKMALERPGVGDLFSRNAPLVAFIAAAFWAVHPLQTETVTYVSQRCEAMTGLFLFGTLYCLAKGRVASRGGSVWRVAALIAFACGLGSKETMIFTLPLIVLFERVYFAASWSETFRRGKTFYLGVIALLAIPVSASLYRGNFFSMLSSLWTRGETGPLDYLFTQPKAIARYLRLSVWPDGLCFDYGWPLATTLAEQLWPSLLLSLLATLTIWTMTRRPRVGFLGVWFFLTLASRSLIPGLDIVVEHRLYLPLAGLCVLAALGFGFIIDAPELKGRFAFAFTACVVVALAATTVARNQVYAVPARLWADTVDKSPNNPRALNYLGIQTALAGDLPRARQLFERSLSIMPDNAEVLTNLANVLAQSGELDASLGLYRQSLGAGKKGKRKAVFDQVAAGAALNMARIGKLKGDFATTVEGYERATSLGPSAATFHEFGAFLLEIGDGPAAEKQLRQAETFSPNNVLLINDIGAAELLSGKFAEAERTFRRAAEIDPNCPALLHNLEILKRKRAGAAPR